MSDPGLKERIKPILDAAAAPGWCLALSGGLDSTVLLYLLADYVARHDAPPLRAIHVNHGLHREAGEWGARCQQLCAALDVPLVTVEVAVGTGSGPEDAARQARYRAFEENLGDREILYMAHHMDDQVETFMLRLLRGAGPDGLAGMPASRPLGAGRLLRPLLAVPRADLLSYATARKLTWVDDPSNADERFDRNYLRREVLPRLEQRWPAYRRSISRSAGLLDQMRSDLHARDAISGTIFSRFGDRGTELQPLLEQAPATAARALRAWLSGQGLAMPDARSLGEFLRQLRSAAPDRNPLLDCGDYRLQRFQDGLFLLPEAAPPPEGLSLQMGDALDIPGVGQVSLVESSGPGIALSAGQHLSIAFRRGGESCRPAGSAHQRSLKKLLQDAAVPPWWRDRMPLLYLDGELLQVGELYLCESSLLRASPESGQSLWTLQWTRPELHQV